MNRRRLLLLALVVVVLCLNLWHWWPSRPAVHADKRAAAAAWPQEILRVKAAIGSEGMPPARRDLFQPKMTVVKAPPAPEKAAPPPAPPAKTPEQLNEEAARAELAQIKLVGILFREEKGEAFIVLRDQLYTARTGERVGERFQVEVIGRDGIHVKDPATRVGGQIPVSGR